MSRDAIEHCHNEADGEKEGEPAEGETPYEETERFAENHAEDGAARGAQCDANTDFADALCKVGGE